MNDGYVSYRYENGDYIITYDTYNTISSLIIGKKDEQDPKGYYIIKELKGEAADVLYLIVKRYANCERFIEQAKLDLGLKGDDEIESVEKE